MTELQRMPDPVETPEQVRRNGEGDAMTGEPYRGRVGAGRVDGRSFDLAGCRALVTGATGFIGSHVARGLMQAGAEVVGLVRDASRAAGLTELGVSSVEGELTDQPSLLAATEGCDLVFHLAATVNVTKGWTYYRAVNVGGTEALALASLERGVKRFVYVSSVSVYGMSAGAGITEASPHLPSGDAYADTKREAEALVRHLVAERGLPAVIAQPSQVYGPGDQNWTMTPIRMIESGRLRLVNGGTGVIQPIFVDDLVEGLLATARRGNVGEAYILCGAEVVSIHDYADRFARMLGKPTPSSVPAWLALPVAAANETLAGILGYSPSLSRRAVRSQILTTTFEGEKASRELGFTPSINLDMGVERIAGWLEEAAPR